MIMALILLKSYQSPYLPMPHECIPNNFTEIIKTGSRLMVQKQKKKKKSWTKTMFGCLIFFPFMERSHHLAALELSVGGFPVSRQVYELLLV